MTQSQSLCSCSRHHSPLRPLHHLPSHRWGCDPSPYMCCVMRKSEEKWRINTHKFVGGDYAKLGEDLLQLLLRLVLPKVLHIHICELFNLQYYILRLTRKVLGWIESPPSPPSLSPSLSWAQKSQQTPSSRAAAFRSPAFLSHLSSTHTYATMSYV